MGISDGIVIGSVFIFSGLVVVAAGLRSIAGAVPKKKRRVGDAIRLLIGIESGLSTDHEIVEDKLLKALMASEDMRERALLLVLIGRIRYLKDHKDKLLTSKDLGTENERTSRACVRYADLLRKMASDVDFDAGKFFESQA